MFIGRLALPSSIDYPGNDTNKENENDKGNKDRRHAWAIRLDPKKATDLNHLVLSCSNLLFNFFELTINLYSSPWFSTTAEMGDAC